MPIKVIGDSPILEFFPQSGQADAGMLHFRIILASCADFTDRWGSAMRDEAVCIAHLQDLSAGAVRSSLPWQGAPPQGTYRLLTKVTSHADVEWTDRALQQDSCPAWADMLLNASSAAGQPCPVTPSTTVKQLTAFSTSARSRACL